MQSKPKTSPLNWVAKVYECLLLIAVIWIVAFLASGTVAHASQPLLTYETAAPGEAPSWLLVYADGRVERDLAPYMKQAGRQVGQLDSTQFAAIQRLVATVLAGDAQEIQQHAGNHAEDDLGLVSLTVAAEGESRSLSWRPVPGLDTGPAPIDVDSALASLLFAADFH